MLDAAMKVKTTASEVNIRPLALASISTPPSPNYFPTIY